MHRQLTLPKPTPALGQFYYEKNLSMRLDHSSDARKNYAIYLNSNRRQPLLQYRPIKIDIEPISRCNFRCTMCVVSSWDKGKRAQDLTLESFEQILESEPQVVEIKLQGLGEPLMLGDSLFEMIRLARRQHIWVRTTTNASLLHLNDNYVKLVDSGICEIQVSIDGAIDTTFESIRKGGKAKRVFNNCQILNSYAEKANWQCAKMWTVVQTSNVGELEDLVHLASDLGFKSQCFAIDLHGWGVEEWNKINSGVEVGSEYLDNSRFLELVEIGKRLGVKVEFWQNATKYSISQPELLCPWPFERTMITSDKRVTPCCMISNPETYEIGSKYHTSSWESTDYQDFRNLHLSGQIPDVCKSCYSDQ